jgi:GNAT superfamily N-acetyltransferase
VHVVEHASASEFLVRTEAFRAAEPILTNIIGSVASGVAAGREYEAELWLTVEHRTDGVVGIAMRTAPHNLVASPMPAEAARALGERLAVLDPCLPGVSGTPDVTRVVVQALGASDRARPGFLNLVRVLEDLRAPAHDCPGRARRVVASDQDRVTDWMAAFGDEAGLHVQPSRDAIRASFLADDAPPLWFWAVDGEPVSLGGHAPLVTTPAGTVARIGPVYTPAEHRGHGFGTAITHAIAGALARECAIVMLYTDAANVTSNSIYAQLGFAEVAAWVEVSLAPIPGVVSPPG